MVVIGSRRCVPVCSSQRSLVSNLVVLAGFALAAWAHQPAQAAQQEGPAIAAEQAAGSSPVDAPRPAAPSTPAPLDGLTLTDEAAKKLLADEEERRKQRRRNKGRIRELEEVRALVGMQCLP
jgi:Spy/CpxP family protein refolding chaperone